MINQLSFLFLEKMWSFSGFWTVTTFEWGRGNEVSGASGVALSEGSSGRNTKCNCSVS